MPVAKSIAPYLPYLRRFARALTGSQASGDAYVVATLEALIADPSIFPPDEDAKIALYRIFLSLWSSLDVNTKPETGAGADKRLNALTPAPRQAFLLRTVEGFSVSQTALVMGLTLEAVEELTKTAGVEIAQQVATDVLIIEDEPIIALDIEALVEELGHRVSGVARTREEAVRMAGEHRPGLVLADIQLADGSSGLDAVNDILTGFDLPVIFITAYPERLLTGERPEPAFLITKPFEPDTVRAAISQALFFERRVAKA